MRRVIRALARRLFRPRDPSADYQVVDRDLAPARGWHDREAARVQHAAYRDLIAELRAGRPRLDLEVAARALEHTGLESPSFLEVGCASGYYAEILEALLRRPVDYTGLDYSAAMLALGRREYPTRPFVLGDGQRLPFRDDAFDIVFNGVSLMHMPDYRAAIAESGRVARSWCIFHTVPVAAGRPTTRLRKNAYGRPVDEVILNEGEMREILATNGLVVRHALPSIAYDLEAVLGEPTRTLTFVCEAA